MSRHAHLIKELADRLRGLEVSSLVYFHTDHFEPWRPVGRQPAVGPEIVESVNAFCRITEQLEFARHLSLFYKPHLNYALRPGDGLVRADPQDLVGFLPRTEREEEMGRAAMQEIVTSSAHDIQLHIHHEYYTATTGHTDPASIEWFATPLGRSLDEKRLELAIHLNRDIIARETGQITERWFFIHGHWALNASDDSSCTITNEIDILLRNGCRGDFTFPAGRSHTDPRIKLPYLCRPNDTEKGYDFPGAQPEAAMGNRASAANKFFIWSSPSRAVQCSLDYMSEGSRKQLENTAKAAKELIDGAYVADRKIFIKTHAHSMHGYYFEHASLPVFPHQLPATQTLLSVVFEAATQAGLEVQFLTAPQVYDLLLASDEKPNVDLVSTYLKPEVITRVRRAVQSPTNGRETVKRRRVAVQQLGPAPALELVRETSADILRQRIEELGVRESGAYDHYGAMLQQGFPIPHHDLVVMDVVRRIIPDLQSYHEIGSGIGILPFLLAFNGFASVGFECDKRRHETAMAIWRELSSKAKVDDGACRLILGRFPTSGVDDTTESVAILTDFITTQTPERERAILVGLRRYRYVLIDLQRFCITRDTPEAQLHLMRKFQTFGFVPTGDPIRANDCAFVLLQNNSAAKYGRGAALWSRLLSLWRYRR